MNLPSKQKGLTFWSWLVIAILVGFNVMQVLKVLPIYLENLEVRGSLEQLMAMEDIHKMRNGDIKKYLLKRFDINMVDSATADHISIETNRRLKEKTVRVKYTATEHMVKNIDVNIHFDESIVILLDKDSNYEE